MSPIVTPTTTTSPVPICCQVTRQICCPQPPIVIHPPPVCCSQTSSVLIQPNSGIPPGSVSIPQVAYPSISFTNGQSVQQTSSNVSPSSFSCCNCCIPCLGRKRRSLAYLQHKLTASRSLFIKKQAHYYASNH